MEFDDIHRKSIIIRPSDPEGIFVMRLTALMEKKIDFLHVLGNQVLVSLIDPADMAKFAEGDSRPLAKYVSVGKEAENRIMVHKRSIFRSLPNSSPARIPLKAGDYFYEFSPHRKN